MASGLVLVIEDDEWVSRLLSSAIRDAGYDVISSTTAKEGFERACVEEPSCIICDVELPDGDGFWVARSIRTQDSRVAVTPFIFLSGLDDPESRMEGYQVGGDIYITKPFRIQEVVAQIEALVQMAERMRRQHDAVEETAREDPVHSDSSGVDIPIDIDVVLNENPSPTEPAEHTKDDPAPAITAIEGDLSQMSIATVLTVLEMERRTGIFEVVSKKRRAQLEIAAGTVVQGTVGGTRVSALTTLRTMLKWSVGRFSFTPLPAREAPPNRKAIGAFLLEAVRLEDEAMRDELELPPSRRMPGQKLSAPALGGPASTADDLAPLSSRAVAALPPSVPVPTPRRSAQAAQAVSAQARATAHAIEEPQTSTHEIEPVPMSQAQSTIDIDIEPISMQPTGGGSAIFPGLANITGTHRISKPAAKTAAPKPATPPPPPRTTPPPPPAAPRPAASPPTPPPLPAKREGTPLPPAGGASKSVVPPAPPRPATRPPPPPLPTPTGPKPVPVPPPPPLPLPKKR